MTHDQWFDQAISVITKIAEIGVHDIAVRQTPLMISFCEMKVGDQLRALADLTYRAATAKDASHAHVMTTMALVALLLNEMALSEHSTELRLRESGLTEDA